MKIKRIVALVLALTMIFTFMAMSASAATTEVQPRGTCPSCINGYISSTKKLAKDENPYNNDYDLTTCPKTGAQHAHYKNVKFTIAAECNLCSYTETTTFYGWWCPYGYYGG